ncbi:hypothetical protein [Clostridium butyricum]|uniref:hypothetical protein n=1 Tax=Clostridium butyricum TaxID=1492 RepID=UPI0022E5CC7A|nr:hypothetical protein [Clostridium butyricum]
MVSTKENMLLWEQRIEEIQITVPNNFNKNSLAEIMMHHIADGAEASAISL